MMTFGRLTCLEFLGEQGKSGTGGTFWKCRCSCGNTVNVRAYRLKSGKTKSCGCLNVEQRRINMCRIKHGGCTNKEKLYNVWQHMKNRCMNPRNPQFRHYGGRGITVCQEWGDDYSVFRAWALTNGYAPKLQIDRTNNDGNYEPNNCRWVTALENTSNRRTTVFVLHRGQRVTLASVCRELGVEYSSAMLARVHRGQSVEFAAAELNKKNNL